MTPSAVAQAWPEDWLIPDWPAPASVRAVFTSRSGGVSQAPYDSLNLGNHVGDAPEAVAWNRQRLQQALACPPVFLDQVHGQTALEINFETPHGQSADASLTRHPGVACTVMVADCLPVFFAHQDVPVVAAAHAGWRGLAGQGGGTGILAAAFGKFSLAVNETWNAQMPDRLVAARTLAWLGPCIGPSAFEVGREVKAAFEAIEPAAGAYFAPHANAAGKYNASLSGLARLRLAALGIGQVYGNDGSADWCTFSQPSRFFSHRRSGNVGERGVGGTGRMAACIWLV